MFSDILDQARSHDPHAVATLYDMVVDRIYRSIYYRVLDTHLAEDLTSQVTIKMIKKLHTFRGSSEGEYIAWALQIAYHAVVDNARKQTEDISLTDIEFEGVSHEDPARRLDAQSKLEEVMGCMQTFSDRDRMILIYRIWEDLSYEEISLITGESVSNCKKIVSRSLEKIAANVSYIFYLSILLHYVA